MLKYAINYRVFEIYTPRVNHNGYITSEKQFNLYEILALVFVFCKLVPISSL